MNRYLILAQSDVTANALGAWLQLLGEVGFGLDDPRRIVWNREAFSGSGESGVMAYEFLARRIENAAGGTDGKVPLNEIVVLVDAISPSQLSATEENATWNNLIAMLILTFPEMHWVFGVTSGNPNNPEEQQGQKTFFSASEMSLPSLLTRTRREPLFDALALRQWVKDCTVAKLKYKLPNRTRKAAAIDEEKIYAYFHAYTAFRYGYCAEAVSSWALMSALFRLENEPRKSHGFDLLLEDMSLNFPDKPLERHILDLDVSSNNQGRAHYFRKLDSKNPALEDSRFRILITTGQEGVDRGTLKKNIDYLKNHKKSRGRKILKPAGGMMDLWQGAGLFRFLRQTGNRRGNVENFYWPPKQLDDNIPVRAGHGAPGKLMLIADTLLNRATDLLPKAKTVQDYIQGAVLATEAAELLSGMTPTLTLQALLLKHEFEARAECAFVGVGFHFDVQTRAKEIEQEIKAIVRWFDKNKRRESELHALITIMSRLAQVFREAGRFEEEHECLVRMRRWHRQLIGSKTTNPFLSITNAILNYAEFLLASFPVFILAILVWLGSSSILWWFIDGSWKNAVNGVWTAFFSGTAAAPSSSWSLIALSCIVIASGFFHLGVLVTYIYALISRR